MFNAEHLQEKWAPLLNAEGVDEIKDPHRKAVTAVLLENQEKFLRDEQSFGQNGTITEASPTNSANAAGASGGFSGSSAAAGPTAGFDPTMKLDGRNKYVKKAIKDLMDRSQKRKEKKAAKKALEFNPYFKPHGRTS